jgi:AraC-like DNA-binding protein
LETIPATLSGNRSALQTFRLNDSSQTKPEAEFSIFYHKGRIIRSHPVQTGYYSLALCLNGSSTYEINDQQVSISRNGIHLFPPHSLRHLRETSHDLEVWVILFRKDFLSGDLIRPEIVDSLLHTPASFSPFADLSEETCARLLELFIRLDREYHSPARFRNQMLRLLLAELLIELHRVSETVPLRLPPQNRGRQLVAGFLELVNKHFLTLRSVHDYASLLAISAGHLSDTVKLETGQSPLRIIHARLFAEAKYLITTGGLSLKETAAQLNFDTPSHFSRFFKQASGISPSAYLRQAV